MRLDLDAAFYVHEGAAARGGNNESHDPVSHALVHEGAAARGGNNKRRRVPFTRVLLPEGGNNGLAGRAPRASGSRGCCCPRGQQRGPSSLGPERVYEGAAARGGQQPSRRSMLDALVRSSRGCCCPRGQQLDRAFWVMLCSRATYRRGVFTRVLLPEGATTEDACTGHAFTRVLLPEGATTVAKLAGVLA